MPVVDGEEVVQIASHLTSRDCGGGKIEPGHLRDLLRQKGHLDFSGRMDVLFQCDLLSLLFVQTGVLDRNCGVNGKCVEDLFVLLRKGSCPFVQELKHADDRSFLVLHRHTKDRLRPVSADPVDIGIEPRVIVGIRNIQRVPRCCDISRDSHPLRKAYVDVLVPLEGPRP